MPRSGLSDLVEYFGYRANGIQQQASLQKIFDNSSDRGENRERILQGFLKDHLPKRCEIIRGGYAFDIFGNKSRQIDLIVTSEFTLQFSQKVGEIDTKSFNCAEGTLAAISVKSKLNKTELADAIDNLASLPTAREFLQNDLNDLFTYELVSQTPYKIIFAFNSINLDDLLLDLKNYLKANKIPREKAPDLIIANNHFYIAKKQSGQSTRNVGDYSAYGSYLAVSASPSIGGLCLLTLVSAIQRLSNLGSLVMLNFFNYESRAELAVNDGELKKELIDRKEFFSG